MFLPIGTDEGSSETAWATISLIAICVVLQLMNSLSPSYEQRLTSYCASDVGLETTELLVTAGMNRASETSDRCEQAILSLWDGEARRLMGSSKLSREDRNRLGYLIKRSEKSVDLWGWRAFQPRKFNIVTMFTSALNHGGWFHLIGNMIFLWVFGSVLEGLVGPLALLAIFFGSSAVADAVYGLLGMIGVIDPLPTLGASAGVYGILAGVWRKMPRLKVNVAFWMFTFVRMIKVPATLLIGFYVLSDLASMIFTSGSGTNFLGHLTAFFFIFLILDQTPREREYALDFEPHRYDVTPTHIE